MVEARSATVGRVVRGQLCSGCGLCAGLSGGAIEMHSAAPGYNRPVQTRPIGADVEGHIAAACPGAAVAAWPPAPATDPLWGPHRWVATGHAVDEEVRFRGSSGGALSAIAMHALRSGVVDRVAHVVASPTEPTGTCFTLSRTADEVLDGAGSRYAASSPLAALEAMLAGGGRIAFIGKPCDVSALRRMQERDASLLERIPIALSFFCAGVPSRGAAKRLLGAMGVASEDVARFRYRGHGWPGQATAFLHDGQVVEMSYEQSWGDYLSHEVQFRCKICPDAVGGAADVACGDAWFEGAHGYPDFAERQGRSLIIARTERGEALLQSARRLGVLVADPLDVRAIDHMQPSQADRKRAVRARVAALAVTGQPRPTMRGVGVELAARQAGMFGTARNFLGTMRRIVMRRR